MNKTRLVQEIAASTNLPAKDVAKVVDSLLERVIRAVAHGDKVVFSGFGTFYRRTRARRIARDIWADKPIEVPATTVPAFRPGKPFQELVARRRTRRTRVTSRARSRGTRTAT